MNCVIISAMSNACVSRLCGTHHQAIPSLSTRKKHGNGILRTISTCKSTLISPTAPFIGHPPSSLVLAAQLTPSEAPQRSDEWFALRKDKLTTSTFSTALGFWKGTRRFELWNEKVFASEIEVVETSKKSAMEWGVLNEGEAIDRYRSITGHEVSSLGFATHSEERFGWMGASPDGLLGCFPGGGILEVKCPYNKGKPEMGLPWSTMPFYYMPQVQGQMEIMDRDWVDLYCWTPNGSTIFRVQRERGYWELIHGILREFWWEHVIPAKAALLLGSKEGAMSYKPESTHKQTGLAIFKSIKLAGEAKLLCREIAGHVEFYR
jgi:putative phage-type endonuclease|uniref:YqaJ viral recombinase domain-containing protein n=1 Tax=Fagus sylvatica TaxID=28930 RepID=A0A2N9FSW6_FAGSY